MIKIYMFLTGSHKVGLMGLVLVPFRTLKMNWKKPQKKSVEPRKKGGGAHKKKLTELVFSRQKHVVQGVKCETESVLGENQAAFTTAFNQLLLLLLHNARGHSDALKAGRGGSKRTRAQKKLKDSKDRG